jgi:hypothetical protein
MFFRIGNCHTEDSVEKFKIACVAGFIIMPYYTSIYFWMPVYLVAVISYMIYAYIEGNVAAFHAQVKFYNWRVYLVFPSEDYAVEFCKANKIGWLFRYVCFNGYYNALTF